MKGETEGTLLAFLVLVLLGLEPVIIKSNPVNPLAFASLSAIFASLILWPPPCWFAGMWKKSGKARGS